MLNKEYLKRLILYQFGSLKNFSKSLGVSQKTVYCWFAEEGSIPLKQLEQILNKIDDIEIDKNKLFILERN